MNPLNQEKAKKTYYTKTSNKIPSLVKILLNVHVLVKRLSRLPVYNSIFED